MELTILVIMVALPLLGLCALPIMAHGQPQLATAAVKRRAEDR